MGVSLRRAGSGPDDPFRLVTSAGKIVADPDDPSKPLEISIKAEDLKVAGPPESPEIKALREELAAERQSRENDRKAAEKAQQDTRVKSLIDQATAHAGSLVTAGKITAASQTVLSAHMALASLVQAGLPVPDNLRAAATPDALKAALDELPGTGLSDPAIDPGVDLETVPAGNPGQKMTAEEAGRIYYQEQDRKQRRVPAGNGQS